MYIPVDSNMRAKDIKIEITPDHLFLSLKGKVYIDQDFPEKVKADDAIWTLEDYENN